MLVRTLIGEEFEGIGDKGHCPQIVPTSHRCQQRRQCSQWNGVVKGKRRESNSLGLFIVAITRKRYISRAASRDQPELESAFGQLQIVNFMFHQTIQVPIFEETAGLSLWDRFPGSHLFHATSWKFVLCLRLSEYCILNIRGLVDIDIKLAKVRVSPRKDQDIHEDCRCLEPCASGHFLPLRLFVRHSIVVENDGDVANIFPEFSRIFILPILRNTDHLQCNAQSSNVFLSADREYVDHHRIIVTLSHCFADIHLAIPYVLLQVFPDQTCCDQVRVCLLHFILRERIDYFDVKSIKSLFE